jgi:undecaprenyl-diphosphatase
MEGLKAILLGALQGITEFLPISSSGHIVLAKEYLDFHINSLPFTVCLHLGSLFAILVFFRKDIKKIMEGVVKGLKKRRYKEWMNSEEGNYLFLIILGTLPIFCVGPFIRGSVEKIFDLPGLVGLLLIANGIMLWAAERFFPKTTKGKIGRKEALVVGCAQVIGTIPGVSRSGVTIASGMLVGVERKAAASYSFLLAIPAIMGANVLELVQKGSSLNITEVIPFYYIMGGVVAFCVSLFSLRFLFWVLKRKKLSLFFPYCVVLGSILVVGEWVRL